MSKKGWSRGFPWKTTMPMFFYDHEIPRNISSVLPWATLRDLVSSVMLVEFYPGIPNHNGDFQKCKIEIEARILNRIDFEPIILPVKLCAWGSVYSESVNITMKDSVTNTWMVSAVLFAWTIDNWILVNLSSSLSPLRISISKIFRASSTSISFNCFSSSSIFWDKFLGKAIRMTPGDF